jgi:hypothetical protein
MNRLKIIISLTLLLSGTVTAQDFSTVCREQMNQLSYFAGRWKGEAKVTQQGGVVINVAQEETIEYKLDSLLLEVEGVGRKPTEPSNISFHALGYISYNAVKKSYEMKSFLKDGRQTDAYFTMVEKNRYDWGFDVPGGKIVYHIIIDPATRQWKETGEFSRDGTQWYPFYEMTLTKQL